MLKCMFCGKEAKVRGSMGDFCMECFEDKFKDNYVLVDGPSFEESDLKFMAPKSGSRKKGE